jgi:hypothetical protein
MPRSAKPGRERPLTHSERGEMGVMARLAAEDWSAMTRKANASENHVKSAERWFRKAREANPALDDEQAARLAEHMRHQHYVRMGRISAEVRRLARQAQAELDAARAEPAGTAGEAAAG